MQRRFPVLSLGLILVLLAVAAGPGFGRARAQDPVELLIWDQFTGPETEAVDAIYQEFAEANNVTITREVIDADQMRQTLNTALASGTGPDLVVSDAGPAYAGLLADAGLIVPLDDLAAEYGWADRIAPAAIQGATIGDQLYSLPLTIDLIGVYVNQTLMDEAGLAVPTTFAELLTFCGAAAEAGYIPFAFANNPGWQAFHQFAMTSNDMIGPDAMQALLFENRGRWDSPEMVTAIKSYFVDMREAGCFSDDANALTYDDGNGLFFAGDALMHSTGSWLVRDINANMTDFEVTMMPFPAPDGAAGSYWSSGVGSAFYLSAGSSPEQQDAAGRFLDYVVSPETAQRWVGEAGFYLPLEVDTTGLGVTPLFQSVLDVLESAANGETELGYNVDVLAPPGFNDAMQNGFQAVLAGDKTPEQQAADLQAAWDEGFQSEATPAA